MNRFGARVVVTAVLAGFLSSCTGGMVPMRLPVTTRPPQARAASVDGVKQVVQDVVNTFFLARDRDKDKYLTLAESGMKPEEFSRADKTPSPVPDHKLSLTEAIDFYHREVYGALNQKALALFKSLDRDANDRLSMPEFLQTPLSTKGPNGEPAMATNMLYRMMDRNRNYLVDFEEFEDLIAWDTANLVPLPGTATTAPVVPGPATPGGTTPAPQPNEPPAAPPAPQPLPVPPKPPVLPPVPKPPGIPIANPDSPPPERW